MSKRSKEKKPALADWEVRFTGGLTLIRKAWWTRDKRGGYTFFDETGVLMQDFSPMTAPCVRRADPLPADPRPVTEDETRQSGYELAGPKILPVKPHRSKP